MLGWTGKLVEDEPKLDLLPLDYREFADVFKKHYAKYLPPHHSHGLSIQIEGGNAPLLGPIYSFSAMELHML